MNINKKNGLFINFLSQQTNNNLIRNRKNEEPLFSTQAPGEKGGKPDMSILNPDFEFGENTTFSLGEEGGMIGEPSDPILDPGPILKPGNPGEATTQSIGEEGGMIGDPGEPILDPGPILEPGNPFEATTQSIGEEGGMIGEPSDPILDPGPILKPGNPGEATTQSIGEEGGMIGDPGEPILDPGPVLKPGFGSGENITQALNETGGAF